jgi:primosomal protein N' (replication factor Y)
MFAQVLLLNGFERPFWYRVPAHLALSLKQGSLVHVPLQKRLETALVMQVATRLDASITFAVRDVEGMALFPGDPHYTIFMEKMARFHCLQPLYFYQRIRHFLKEKTVSGLVLPEVIAPAVTADDAVTLTDEQQLIVDALTPDITTPSFKPVVIHGVTGSGKTEVYKRLIMHAWQQGKSTVLLLPEVALAIRFQFLLTKALGQIPIFGFHSGSTPKEKKRLWDALHQNAPLLIIGVHLPMMLPIPRLGLMILDEEHEQSFIEKKLPKINSKEMALWRAQLYGIPIILGSATPSLSSLHNVQHNGWRLFHITKRFGGAFPSIKKVVLTDKSRQQGTYFWISKELEKAVAGRLQKKEQVIIFINRRGYSFFVQCKECGHVCICKNCSVSLTYHEPAILRCHYCEYSCQMPLACPGCKATGDVLLKKGIGTQQVVHMFKKLFPAAVVERADLDSTKNKREWQQVAERMFQGEIDILIGTQSITKGYHFPGVTLVGVLWADVNIHFPVYNAAEITLQQLIQVAGRAGRATADGQVIVQLMRDNPLFDFADEQRYMDFAKEELVTRELAGYPPCMRLASIEIRHADAATVDFDAHTIATYLRHVIAEMGLAVTLLGPSFPVVTRVQEQEIRHLIFKSGAFKDLHAVLQLAQQIRVQSAVYVIVSS